MHPHAVSWGVHRTCGEPTETKTPHPHTVLILVRLSIHLLIGDGRHRALPGQGRRAAQDANVLPRHLARRRQAARPRRPGRGGDAAPRHPRKGRPVFFQKSSTTKKIASAGIETVHFTPRAPSHAGLRCPRRSSDRNRIDGRSQHSGFCGTHVYRTGLLEILHAQLARKQYGTIKRASVGGFLEFVGSPTRTHHGGCVVRCRRANVNRDLTATHAYWGVFWGFFFAGGPQGGARAQARGHGVHDRLHPAVPRALSPARPAWPPQAPRQDPPTHRVLRPAKKR